MSDLTLLYPIRNHTYKNLFYAFTKLMELVTSKDLVFAHFVNEK